MKKCNACEITYTDDKKFCKKCGSVLTDEKKVETKETAKKLVFEERLKADPLNLKILKEFALFLSDNSMFSDTISISLKILAIDETDLIAKKLLTDAYYRLNKYEQAIESAEQLLAEKPGDTELLKILIDALHTSGKYDIAILYCDKLLAFEPLNNEVLHTKALSLLLSDQIAEASEIFAKLQKEGFKDRHTLIYAGISCSLNNDFETAIEILNPVLSDKELSYSDIDNNRGFLFMAYCLSQFEITSGKVDKWFSYIDFNILKENHHVLDEQTYVKLAVSVFERMFAREQPALSRYNIEDLIHKYLKSKSEYLTVQTKELQAELWYKISLKQAEMKLFNEAKQSLDKSIDFMPFKTEYSEKLKEISQLHENLKRRKKRKSIIIWSIVIALILIVAAAVYIDKRQKENKAWEAATTENSSISYQRYLRKYPEGRFSKEAMGLKEEALWQKSKEANTSESYDNYISEYRSGRYIAEAFILQEEALWKQATAERTLERYQYYIEKFPNGKHTKEARSKLVITDNRDGKTYKVVKIGKQWWMAENLNYYTSKGSRCYEDKNINCSIYGRLYNWETANKACPDGWHLPNISQWDILIDYLGGTDVAGRKMKNTSGWHDGGNGSNESGFAALPSWGQYHGIGNWSQLGMVSYWWSATTGPYSEAAYSRSLSFNSSKMHPSGYEWKYRYISVRCIRD